MLRLHIVGLMVLSQVLQTIGYPQGAPTAACGTLTPGHGSESTNNNPYSITISSKKYTAGGTITVTVTGTFAGILMQVRKKGVTDVKKYGTFETPPSGTRLMDCSTTSDTITHSNPNAKTNPSFTWNAPDDDEGELEFVVTLAESKLVWWKNIKSEPLTFDSGATPSSTTTTTTQGTTDNSAQSSTSVSVMPGSSTMNEVTSSTTTKRILKPTRGTSSAVTWCKSGQLIILFTLGMYILREYCLQ